MSTTDVDVANQAERQSVAATEIDWDDIDKASHQSHALLRELAESELLAELVAEAVEDLGRRLAEVDHTERLLLLSPTDRDWVLEVLVGDDAPPAEPAPPSTAYSVLSVRGGFNFTIFHRDGTDGRLVASVTRFEQPGSCYTCRASLVQTLGTTNDTLALILRRRTAPIAEHAAADPERIASVRARLRAVEVSR